MMISYLHIPIETLPAVTSAALPGRDARSGEALAIRKALLQDAEAETLDGRRGGGG